MKLRQDFVSNSSSSSFICGVGKIKNLAKVKQKLAELKLDEYDCKIYSTSDLVKMIGINEHGYCNPRVTQSSITCSAAVNSEPEVSTKFNPKTEDYYIILDIGNNEGDEAFVIRDEAGEYIDLDYDKANDIEYFPVNQQEAYKMMKDPKIVTGVQIIHGADRNG